MTAACNTPLSVPSAEPVPPHSQAEEWIPGWAGTQPHLGHEVPKRCWHWAGSKAAGTHWLCINSFWQGIRTGKRWFSEELGHQKVIPQHHCGLKVLKLLYPDCFLCLGNPCTLIASSFGLQWTWPPGCLSESLSLNWNGTGNAYRGRSCSIPSLSSLSPPLPLPPCLLPLPFFWFFALSAKENVTHKSVTIILCT